ncbi:MAG TPA: rod-binding protein, partial [Nitrospira sp.]
PEGALANKQGTYFYSFYDEEIGKRAAESGGIGIAKMVQDYAQQYFSSPPGNAQVLLSRNR